MTRSLLHKSKYIAVGFALVFAFSLLGCDGDDGATGPAGPAGEEGPAGDTGPLPPGVDRELAVTMAVSQPANGTHFVAGEQAVVTVTLLDGFGQAFSPDDFSSLNLYMYGPQDTRRTVTAVKLLNASTDRAQRPHHYIDLKQNADVVLQQNADVVVRQNGDGQGDGNVLTYTLQPVTDEEPGTYTLALWATLSEDALKQTFELVDLQIGTATVETQIVEKEMCAVCHLGTDSGQLYFHHVDPGYSPDGNPAIDSWPVRTCKSCHNTDGYAAFRDPTNPDVLIPDPIVNRVHGVHNGSHLENPLNIGFDPDQTNGVFADYVHVEFPADVRNCTYCHVDDRWKTEPSRLACGACHDNVWFGDPASMPATAEAHPGGPQSDDSLCALCHPADSGGTAAVAEAHTIEPPAFQNSVELSITASANGQYFTAGESPQVTITIRDAATDAVIDPNTIVEPADSGNVAANEWRRANFFVSGPREHTMPVLTTAAVDHSTHYYANNDFRVRIDPANEDPSITRSSTAITYQLDDVAGLEPGTYTAFVEIMPSAPIGGWAFINFQVGTETEDPLIATNCTECHNDTRMHASYFAVEFNPDICKNCHDYERQIEDTTTGLTDSTGWTDRNWGFGAAPLSRRIHGVHFGHYLDKPEEVHGSHDYSHTIFPQDVRNCTKCHGDNSMWKEESSRLACLACHDSDAAITHGNLMTQDATPDDPWNGDEAESCNACHGAGRDFAPDEAHNISAPYVPPYPREHPHTE
jgi:hypothetical protein